uniref:Protein kinase domain-containing protein n=1 Tax=Panagrellus redivivus TaxID=6233 RepID=A0A7E4VM30_PANRE
MVRFCGAYQLLRFTHRRYRKVNATTFFKQNYDLSSNSKLLGNGKYANVYLSQNRKNGREVAVKLMLDDGSERAQRSRERFRFELYLLRNCHHPGVIKHVFSFATKKFMIVVMDRMAGDLFSYMMNGKDQHLTERTTKFIARQLFSALDYLHDRDIVHCDVKPENVLLDDMNLEFPHAKLCDFGLSKRIKDVEYAQHTVGTYIYLAPEILLKKEYTKAVDIWAMGVMIYAALTSTMPFEEPTKKAKHIYKGLARKSFLFPRHLFYNVSRHAKKFLTSIFNPINTERPTADECLDDPWLDDAVVYADVRQLELRLNTGRFLTSVEEDVRFEKFLKTRGIPSCIPF